MVANRANERRQALSFMTAPPVIRMASRRRFRAGRNLPYRDAAPYKSSIYYWWWAFLKRNVTYWNTCRRSGQGKLAALYKDFGNVFESDFLTWWNGHQLLFAEQAGAITSEVSIVYQIDPRRPWSQIHEEVKALHMRGLPGAQVSPCKQGSTALYPIYANVSAHTLHQVLQAWDLRQDHPEASAYDLGILAGYKANLMPGPKFGETRTKEALTTARHNKRARVAIANKTNRYLRVAEQYIDNVARGEFPKSTRR